MEIRVQRGVQVFSGTSSTAVLPLTVNTSKSFVFLTHVTHMGGGPDAGIQIDKNLIDTSGGVKLTSSTQLTFTRPSGAEVLDYRFNWELWEYVGAVGGPHEFLVRQHADGFMGTGSILFDSPAIGSISDIGSVLPVLSGVQFNGSNQNLARSTCLIRRLGTNQIRIERLIGADEVLATYAVVEFTGSAWSLQEALHSFTAAGVDEAETITAVGSWTKAFVFASNLARSDVDPNANNTVRPGATTSSVRFRLAAAASAIGHNCYAYVVENSQLGVEHLDSITGGRSPHVAGFPPPDDYDESITALSDLAQAGSFLTHDTTPNRQDTPAPQWGWKILNATTLRVESTRNGTQGHWAAQAIDFSQMTPTTALEANPVPVVASAPIPVPAAQPGPVSANVAPVGASGFVPDQIAEPGPVAVNPVSIAAAGVVPAPTASVGVVANMAVTSAAAAVPVPSAIPGAVSANPPSVPAQAAVPAPSAGGALTANVGPVQAAANVPVLAAVPGGAMANPPPVLSLARVAVISTVEPGGLSLEVDSLPRIQENVESLAAIQVDVDSLAVEASNVDALKSVDLEVDTMSALSFDVTALGG